MTARPPVFVAYHARTGITALNVVSAALDGEVRFARTAAEMAAELRAVHDGGGLALAGWSFYSPDFPRAAEDLARVRALAPVPAVHVAGGVHASAEPLATLRAGFDLCAIGEGETTIGALAAALARGEDPRRAVRGLAWLEDGALRGSGPGERRPLDDFPACNLRHGKWNALEITRGCIYACAFCQTPFMFKARFRHRSVANVRAHVEAMRAGGLRYLRFLSPTSLSYGSSDATPNLDAVDALLAAVREALPEGRIYFGTFPSEVRPEHVTAEALAILARRVDNRTLVIGGQSGSERVLAELQRGHGVGEIERAVRLALAHGFRPDVDFILGLPGETAEDRRATLRLAGDLVALGARVHSHAFMPLPGTPLRDAVPAPIERDVDREMARLESAGASYGQWRQQVVIAADLLRRRHPRL